MELKNETTKFCPLFLCCKAYICLIFEYLFFIVELGHQKVKIRKSQHGNENRLVVNLKFSFCSGYLFCNSHTSEKPHCIAKNGLTVRFFLVFGII